MCLYAQDVVDTCADSASIKEGRLDKKGIGALMKTFAALALLVLLFISTAVGQTGPDSREVKGHYFLVVDHSGSMLQQIRSGPAEGRTRWDLMRERAEAFIGRLPEGSTVWVGVFNALEQSNFDKISEIMPIPLDGWLEPFSADLSSPEQRNQLMAQISTFPEPNVANGTWLYQAIATALDRVENVGARDPDAFMTLLIYTDGVDEGYGRGRAEMLQNPTSPIARAVLQKRQEQLQERHPNLNVINIYRPGDESIHDAHVVRLSPNRMRLPSPIMAPEQTIQFGLQFSDDDAIRLEGRPLTLKWQTESDEESPPLRIEGGPFRMVNGKLDVVLVADGDWPVGRDVKAKLKIVYPAIDDVFITEEGGSVIDLTFQGAEAPTISDMVPSEGSAFPVGQRIGFSLTTLPNVSVEWIFDDGVIMRGNPVMREFDAPRERSVTARVTDPRTGLTGTKVSRLAITQLEVSLDPLPIDVMSGTEVSLTASAQGDFRSFEWLIGGRSYAGVPRKDGNPGSALTLSFDRPGEVPIQIFGRGAEGGVAEAAPAVLRVNAVPTLRVPSPNQGESLYFGTRREFRAEIQGLEVDRVRFALSVGEDELFSRDVDVRTEGPVRLALLPIDMPTLPVRSGARLLVSTPDTDPVMSREINVILEAEPTFITITIPEGREPQINRETPIQLNANAAIDDIRWNFGEGWTDGTAVMRHAWDAYGSFEVQAEAIGMDGTRLMATPVDITIPVRRIEASGKLLYRGRVVGSEVTKVPRRSTLQLVDQSVGDIVDKRWSINGVELRPGQSTLTVDEYGTYEVELTVAGTPEAGKDQAVIVFQTNDRFLFWIWTLLVLVVTGLFAKLLLGNKWRHAEFGTQRIAKSEQDPGQPDIAKKGLLTGRDRVGSWNFWTKSTRISLAKLDDTVCKSWKSTDQLLFQPRGRDISLSWAKGSHNRAKRIDPTNEQSLRGWERRWRIQRPLNRDDEARSGAIFLRRSPNINLARRWWPQFSLFVVVCAGLYALRYLVATLY